MRTHEDFENLHVLRDPFSNRFFRGRIRFPQEVDPNLLLTGAADVREPLIVDRSEGNRLADIVWTDHVAVVLISDRLVQAFRAASFSGWATYQVRLEAGEAIQGYLGLTIVGRSGPIDNTRGEWVRKDDEPGRFRQGLLFDEPSWDGSDFFVPAGTLYKFVSQQVADCLNRLQVKNVRCQRLRDVLVPEVVIRNTPARQ